MQNLLPEPPATRLPANDEADAALAAADEAGTDEAFASVAAGFPTYSAGWAELAARAFAQGQVVTAYAYARTGYHRGLDQLRRSGWKGHGPVPWSHEPNRGFLRCLYVLSRAADEIGEADEAARCAQFLRDCDPEAADALASN
ncbi:DUF3151 domain-containing protein [Micromonospora parathelypteridis]|uniref:DUF3151 domain-containing protein n=1 Tax=Micromonospora parathelypteridis TaxID=1839617 RepID=A0A840VP42_9ACTN|nr:DUF3151 domain-containing protein [Micromonospora parathelypteridis]MBB5478445.1 hypothetical protein [Micromonospora parathelypteridis]GGO06209.1 hypothetical protein GCM10011576_09660 [Micromonospora parathelypteridis]